MEVDLTDFFIGGTYKHKSFDNSRKVCENWWPQIQKDPEGKSQYIIETFPGTTAFGSTPGISSRGMHQHGEELYIVIDTTLYRVTEYGEYQTIGTVSGGNRCVFASVGTSLIVTANGKAYEWDGTTFTVGTDSDLGLPNTVTGLNSQAIYDFGSGQTFSVSNAGDYLNINALNYGSAETYGDDLIRPYAFQQTLRLFGKRTVEAWWNTGVGSPPFERIQGAVIPVGLAGRHAITNTNNNVYFLGHDLNVYAIEQNRQVKVSTQPMVREFATYQITEDAVMYNMDFQGGNLVVLNFPSAEKTWVLQEGGEWFNLSTSDSSWIGDSYAYCYGKHLVGTSTGDVLELSDETYTDDSAVIKRTLQSSPIHSGLLGRPGKRLELTSLTVELTTGQGKATGQGSSPRLAMSISENGGRSFGTQYLYDLGVTGKYREQVTFSGLGGSSDSRVVKLELSDPIYCSIHRVMGHMEVGI